MILTGKAKHDFENWLTKGMSIFAHDMEIEFFNQKSEIEKNSIIIEWLDKCTDIEIMRVIWVEWSNSHDISCKEATKQAIIKANEIYNNR